MSIHGESQTHSHFKTEHFKSDDSPKWRLKMFIPIFWENETHVSAVFVTRVGLEKSFS